MAGQGAQRVGQRTTVAVIGGGPAGLMAAEVVAAAGVPVTVFDAMPSVGRKFLMAGRGGLNLTHSEPMPAFLARYGVNAARFAPLLADFGPQALRAWAASLGVGTFVGTSGRVFPDDFKAAPLLRAWVRHLRALGVEFRPRCRWRGFGEDGDLLFDDANGSVAVGADAIVLALGGASWPRLGSDGGWVPLMTSLGCRVSPLRPANCGFEVAWSPFMAPHFGQPLKGVALGYEGTVCRGEMVLTAYGVEGGGIYALSAALRDGIARDGRAVLRVDLKPDLSLAAVTERLARPRGRASLSNWLRKALGVPPQAAALLREAHADIADAARLAEAVKSLPVVLVAPRPLEEAISSAGGLLFEDLDDHLMVRRRPGLFVAGEMLDWEAPTGGYLLTGCFATGVRAGRGALAWLSEKRHSNVS
jgi:hypothetical protein